VQYALQLEDTLWTGLSDPHISTSMGITAENLAEKYDITRQECDEFAVLSNQRWKAGLSSYYSVSLTTTLNSSAGSQLIFPEEPVGLIPCALKQSRW